jgi:thiol-disulfide isomerase/thioredoxin
MGRISLPMDVRSTGDIPAFENMLSRGPMTVILIYADWCGHCNTYKENVWSPLKSTKGRKLNMASVHYDQLENTSLKNSKIEGYPSLLVVGTDKKPATFNTDSGVTNAMPNANELSTMKKIITAPVNVNNSKNSFKNVETDYVSDDNMNSENMKTNTMNSLRNTNTNSMNSLRNTNTNSMNIENMDTENMDTESMDTESMNTMRNTNTNNTMRNTNTNNTNTNNMNTMRNTNTNSMNNSNIDVTTEESPGAIIENITPPNISSDTVSTLSSVNSSPLQPVRSLNTASNSIDEENKPLRNNTQGTTPLLRGGGGLYRRLTGKKQKKNKKRTVKRKN